MAQTRSKEHVLQNLFPGIPMLILGILLFPGSAAYFIYKAASTEDPIWALPIAASVLLGILTYCGLVLVNPNQAKVVLLFGKYRGSIVEAGFRWMNPFTVCHMVSLRLHNFNSDTLKVNDSRGNPIEIGAVVVWRVIDTAQAAFDVEDYKSYVAIQTESAIRHMAAGHPYDCSGEDESETSLRGSADVVNAELKQELTQRLELAGIEVQEVRLQHLAYAPEIAGAMLQRQQAEAIIAARTRIVDGAVGMVKMALDKLQDQGVVDLDEDRKAVMTSNLLTVLCSERGTQPVINTGSLYQ